MTNVYSAQASMFEGLFERALAVAPGSPFAAELRATGCDLEALQPSYDIQVWVGCVDVAWKHAYPGLSRDAAWRQLGRRFIEGYFQTAIGSVIAAALPYMKAARFLDRVPWFLRTGLGGSSCEVELDGQRATLTLRGPHSQSAVLLSGVLEVCFERLGVPGTFVPIALDGVDSRLEVTWSEGG